MTAYAVDTDVDPREDLRSFRQEWWLFLIAGVFWIWLGFMVLNVDATTIGLISVLVGVLLIFAGAEELTNMVVMSQWRWLHGVLRVIFIGGGIFAFAYPGQTFGTLAL